jgi:hypothetical protein
VIIALILPKPLTSATEQPVGSLGIDSLQRAQQLGRMDVRSTQKMNAVGHDNLGVETVMAKLGAVFDRGLDLLGDQRLSKESWATYPNYSSSQPLHVRQRRF